MIGDYNYVIVGVGVADHFRLRYRVELWMHQRKRWWSILLWGLGMDMIHAYILYHKTCDWARQNKKGGL